MPCAGLRSRIDGEGVLSADGDDGPVAAESTNAAVLPLSGPPIAEVLTPGGWLKDGFGPDAIPMMCPCPITSSTASSRGSLPMPIALRLGPILTAHILSPLNLLHLPSIMGRPYLFEEKQKQCSCTSPIKKVRKSYLEDCSWKSNKQSKPFHTEGELP